MRSLVFRLLPILCLLGVVAHQLPASAQEVRSVAVSGIDMGYDSATQQIFAITGTNPGQIVPINPIFGAVGTPVTIGVNPLSMAVTDDGQFIYIAVSLNQKLVRYLPASATIDQSMTFGGLNIEDLATVPTQPHSILVVLEENGISPHFAGVNIYDDTVKRTNNTDGFDVAVFSSPTTFFAYQNSLSSNNFYKFTVDSTGVTGSTNYTGAFGGLGSIEYDNGRIYSSGGAVIDAATGAFVDNSPVLGHPFVLDSADNLLYTITGSDGSTTINAYDETTYILVSSTPIAGVSGNPNHFLRWGENALAFTTDSGKIYLVRLATLATPLHLNAVGGNHKVSLSWDAVGAATSYRVYRGTSPGGEISIPLASGATTNYVDSAVANGTTYHYVVVAENASGTSDPSNEVSASATPGASHFVVSVPASAAAGGAFTFTVTAKDSFGNTVPAYGGIAHFSSTDPQAVLPPNQFIPGGSGTFQVMLKTAGSQTITVSDTRLPSLAGTSNTVAVNPNGTSHFVVAVPASATAGMAVSFTVTAKDAYGNTVPSYGGLAHFTSSDGQANVPSNRFFTGGVGTFMATLATAGEQTISVNDTARPSISGTSSAIAVGPNGTSHFVVVAPSTARVGVSFNFTVTAKDAYGNIVNYGGLAHFSSSDGAAILLSNRFFSGGVGTFPATLKTGGAQTISVNDVGHPVITGASNAVTVAP